MQISYEMVSNAHVRQLIVSLWFLRLSLPSTLNGSFSKMLFKPEEFEITGIVF